MTVRLGDKCSVSINGLWARHFGICVGFDLVGDPVFVHNSYRSGRVTRASLREFSGGRPIRVDGRAPPGLGRRVARRAVSLLGQNYGLVSFNCEHAANLAFHGRSFSRQVVTVGVLALGVATSAWVVSRGT